MERLTLRDVTPTPLAATLPKLAALVSPLTGIFAHVHTGPDLNGNGKARAYAGAIGAACARYAAACRDEEAIRVGNAASIGARAAAPASFALFHPRQYAARDFPYVPFESGTRLRWTPAFRLPGGEPAFVPAQLTALGNALVGEPAIGYATSSGLGCGPTLEEAILAGLLELVEHDASMLAWRTALAFPLIDAAAVEERCGRQRLRECAARSSPIVADLSSVWEIPTALAIVRDRRHGGGVGCASAATLTGAVDVALRKALARHVDGRRFPLDRAVWRCDCAEGAANEPDRVRRTVWPAPQARFLESSPTRVHPTGRAARARDSVTAHIIGVVERLASAGVDTYVVDTTPPDLRGAGLHTVAVVAPQLCRLDVAPRPCYLGGERLYRAALERRLVTRPLTIDDLNLAPHPFA